LSVVDFSPLIYVCAVSVTGPQVAESARE